MSGFGSMVPASSNPTPAASVAQGARKYMLAEFVPDACVTLGFQQCPTLSHRARGVAFCPAWACGTCIICGEAWSCEAGRVTRRVVANCMLQFTISRPEADGGRGFGVDSQRGMEREVAVRLEDGVGQLYPHIVTYIDVYTCIHIHIHTDTHTYIQTHTHPHTRVGSCGITPSLTGPVST